MHMPVSASLLASVCSMLKFWKNRLQVRSNCLNSLRLRAHGEQFLFEIQIQRQRSGKIERQGALIGRRKILHRACQGQNLQMQLNGPGALLLGNRFQLVSHEKHLSAQEGSIAVQLQHLETFTPFGNQIEPAVRIFLRDRQDFRSTPNLRDPLLDGTHHAKLRVVGEALADHLFISRFENVQRQRNAREQHYFKRE